MLLIIKGLFFLEGLLLLNFSPRILLEGTVNTLIYLSAYILAFALVWYTDRTRRFSSTLATCMVLSVSVKHIYGTANFFYILVTAMIIPLTCAFTMMQCNPRQERELWSLQYVWLIVGRLVRFYTEDYFKNYKIILEIGLLPVFIVLTGLIPWLKNRKVTLDPIVQIYTPVSRLLLQPRYWFFLFTVLIASVFCFFARKSSVDLIVVPLEKSSIYIWFFTEIFTCIASYFLVPRRIAPQAFFLIAQLLIAVRCFAFVLAPPKSLVFTVLLEMLTSVGFIMTSMANAQIVATHGKPGLEFTTCAIVDIFRNGIGPALFLSIRPFIHVDTALIGSALFVTIFITKYLIVDYKFDVIIIHPKNLIN